MSQECTILDVVSKTSVILKIRPTPKSLLGLDIYARRAILEDQENDSACNFNFLQSLELRIGSLEKPDHSIRCRPL